MLLKIQKVVLAGRASGWGRRAGWVTGEAPPPGGLRTAAARGSTGRGRGLPDPQLWMWAAGQGRRPPPRTHPSHGSMHPRTDLVTRGGGVGQWVNQKKRDEKRLTPALPPWPTSHPISRGQGRPAEPTPPKPQSKNKATMSTGDRQTGGKPPLRWLLANGTPTPPLSIPSAPDSR